MRRLLPLLLLAACGSAFAHVGADAGGHHGFVAGFSHPILGLDHFAAMLAVGVWSAMTAARVVVAPLAFALTLLAGALMAQWGVAFPAVEPMIAASLLLVGLLLAARVRLPESAAVLLVGVFALFHGAAHGQELLGAGALAGMVLGTAMLHTAGILFGLAMRLQAAWLPRVAGVAVALSGLASGWSLLTV